LSTATVDIAIIGAGPYGLSLAAHLRNSNRSVRVFGSPMRFWSHHMPRGMCLKSEGFASSLFEPEARFTLGAYCAEMGLPYADIGLPVPIETFIAYALEFQRRYVPQLEDVQVTRVARGRQGFEVTTSTGEVASAREVVIATGIMKFANLPEAVAGLPAEFVTHSSQHNDLGRFAGQRVAVLGAGASALDTAALLQRSGADVHLIARRGALAFHDKPKPSRTLVERIKAPRSGLGVGWRSRLCTDIPDVFRALPESLRLRVVERHLGPAPCWFVREMVDGKVQMHLKAQLTGASVEGGKLRLGFDQAGAGHEQIVVDHVIAGTGYKVAMSRLEFLDPALLEGMDRTVDTPILGRHFETSVPGLYVIGAAAANSFGPMLRFAYGAGFAAKRLSRRLSHS
jgi:cation diffusion facilitator CzcD-associated flavoprotein CzcO